MKEVDEMLCKIICLVNLLDVLVVNIFFGIVGLDDIVKKFNWFVIFWLIVYFEIYDY